jgi:hypothetical protein
MSVREAPGTEAAKARLREVGQELEVASWARKHPFTALAAAAVAGSMAARLPRATLRMFFDILGEFVLPVQERPKNGDGPGRAENS